MTFPPPPAKQNYWIDLPDIQSLRPPQNTLEETAEKHFKATNEARDTIQQLETDIEDLRASLREKEVAVQTLQVSVERAEALRISTEETAEEAQSSLCRRLEMASEEMCVIKVLSPSCECL